MIKPRPYIDIACKDCGVLAKRRVDSLSYWGGRCASCSAKEVSSRPAIKKAKSDAAKKLIKSLGGKIHNCGKGVKSGNKNPSWKGGRPLCKDCKTQLGSYKAIRCVVCNAKSKIGTSRTRQYKDKMMELMPRGSNHWNWNGGSSGENRLIRMSARYKEWRVSVFNRDNYTCQVCGNRGGGGRQVILNADHIYPFCDYPELRFDISNGRTLCKDCHKETDTFGWKMANKRNKVK
jgi:hypothetical protein